MNTMLGIDVGGTGIKGAIVDIDSGELLSERFKLKTKQPANTDSIAEQIGEIIEILMWEGDTVGIGFPSVIKEGRSLTAANVDESWLDFPINQFLSEKLNKSVYVINDADAAGLAEYTFNEELNKSGKCLFLTIGTGIGSALFHDGKLIPNLELGHLYYKDSIAEKYVSNNARETKDLSWEKWGKELNKFLNHVDFVFRPNSIILGGGVSKKLEKYDKYLNLDIPIKSAMMLNNAGIVGAALAGYQKLSF